LASRRCSIASSCRRCRECCRRTGKLARHHHRRPRTLSVGWRADRVSGIIRVQRTTVEVVQPGQVDQGTAARPPSRSSESVAASDPRASPSRRGPRHGRSNRRQRSRSLADGSQSGHAYLPVHRLLHRSRPCRPGHGPMNRHVRDPYARWCWRRSRKAAPYPNLRPLPGFATKEAWIAGSSPVMTVIMAGEMAEVAAPKGQPID
jgi:hypothetical protein